MFVDEFVTSIISVAAVLQINNAEFKSKQKACGFVLFFSEGKKNACLYFKHIF